MKKLLPLAVVFGALLLAAPEARAEIVLGLKVGQSDVKIDSFKDDAQSPQAYGGFRFMKFVGLELEYSQLGKFEDNSGPTNDTLEIDRFDLFVVGVLPISRFELYGKLGYGYWDAKVWRGTLRLGDDGSDAAVGAGFAVKFAGILALRVEYEVFEVEGIDDLTMASIGLDFRF